MLYNRTYIEKCATIVDGSAINTGLNPVSELVYGRNLSRTLVYFDHTRIKRLVDDKTYPDKEKLSHRLRITNAGSIDMSELHKKYMSQIDGKVKRRASSFDLIFFLVPDDWDAGKGFDYTMTFMDSDWYDLKVMDKESYKSEDGVNWFQSMNGRPWEVKPSRVISSDGMFTFNVIPSVSVIPSSGGTVDFRFTCECGEITVLDGLSVSVVNDSASSPCRVSEISYFTKYGQLCRTEESKRKYGRICFASIEVPANTRDNDINRIFSIVVNTGNSAWKDKSESGRYYLKFFDMEGNLLKRYISVNKDGDAILELDKEYKSNPISIRQLSSSNINPVKSDGIYSTLTLKKEYDKFLKGKDSIVIASQHFDMGCENIDVDITDTVNKFVDGILENHGICIAYAPVFEETINDDENYIGLLTQLTSSIFQPYVETVYNDSIRDDRGDFVLGKTNRLYLYSNLGGKLQNLDEMPVCTINDVQYEVRQQTKGVYYTELKIDDTEATAPSMMYDTWSNLKYNGHEIPPQELSFTTRNPYEYFGVGTSMPEQNTYVPSCYGIKSGEEIRRGDIRKVVIKTAVQYERNTDARIDGIEARLYTLDGSAELEVFGYMPVEMAFEENYIMIDTSMLIPGTYYIDVRIKYGMEDISHHDVLHFTVVNVNNNRYA
jgi:hypothetical protein